MILPVLAAKWRSPAHFYKSRSKVVENSTNASIVVNAATREYPRTVSVYTIRTPSPGGQHGAHSSLLPAFFSKASVTWNKTGAPDVCRVLKVSTRGFGPCQLKRSFSRSRPVQDLRHVATPWVNRPQVARPSEPAQPSSQVTAPLRALPLVRAPMWPTASSTPASVTDLASDTALSNANAARGNHARRFAWPHLTSIRTAKRTPHVQ